MDEKVIQWVMLRRPKYLARCLDMKLRHKLAENYSTDFGIIDFAFDTIHDEIIVVELETEVNNTAKFDFCIEQSIRYKRLATQVVQPLLVIILYDEVGTPDSFAQRLKQESARHGLGLRTYSMLDVKALYLKCMEALERTSGIYLGRPIAMNITHLRWLNRLMSPFKERGIDVLTEDELASYFSTEGSRTVYRVRRKLAEDFELIEVKKQRDTSTVHLTEFGRRFIDNAIKAPLAISGELDLSHGQRQVLLESLVNGRFTKSKVNIYYLLRFIHLTNGVWMPRERADIGEERVAYLNNFLGTSYKSNTVTRLMRFTFNQCQELGLVDAIETPATLPTFQAYLTTLGSRVLGFLELYLHLAREQLQIPLQV